MSRQVSRSVRSLERPGKGTVLTTPFRRDHAKDDPGMPSVRGSLRGRLPPEECLRV